MDGMVPILVLFNYVSCIPGIQDSKKQQLTFFFLAMWASSVSIEAVLRLLTALTARRRCPCESPRLDSWLNPNHEQGSSHPQGFPHFSRP